MLVSTFVKRSLVAGLISNTLIYPAFEIPNKYFSLDALSLEKLSSIGMLANSLTFLGSEISKMIRF